MGERKSLLEGLKSAGGVAPAVEKEFVHGGRVPHEAAPGARDENVRTGETPGRLPLTTRLRGDYAAALKRASLERQLAGQEPNTLQDILEEALGPWLRANGYVK
ncbi:MAG: hypothetical protein ACRC33_16395 [Gemmataceae bacterium]